MLREGRIVETRERAWREVCNASDKLDLIVEAIMYRMPLLPMKMVLKEISLLDQSKKLCCCSSSKEGALSVL